jgi:hypothetical protein
MKQESVILYKFNLIILKAIGQKNDVAKQTFDSEPIKFTQYHASYFILGRTYAFTLSNIIWINQHDVFISANHKRCSLTEKIQK